MSKSEFESLIALGAFSQGTNSMEGKWFAERFSDALEWGKIMGHDGVFYVVEIEIDEEIFRRLYYQDLLDGIGAGRYAELVDLSKFKFIGAELIDFL
ncbi:MAG: hypothetical protein SF052_05975 [Bacteroidia bacterium]|nr:hypothetical protein [Bacteroidia bacterium]